jgi:hypothetical protein
MKTHIKVPYSTSNTNKINPSRSTELLHFFFTPPSVSDKLHKLTSPSMQFHTKHNGFQQLAYLLVMTGVTLNNTVILQMGFKNEKLQ